jgi:hypothetical protein
VQQMMTPSRPSVLFFFSDFKEAHQAIDDVFIHKYFLKTHPEVLTGRPKLFGKNFADLIF